MQCKQEYQQLGPAIRAENPATGSTPRANSHILPPFDHCFSKQKSSNMSHIKYSFMVLAPHISQLRQINGAQATVLIMAIPLFFQCSVDEKIFS